jgi:hypothetical protein
MYLEGIPIKVITARKYQLLPSNSGKQTDTQTAICVRW